MMNRPTKWYDQKNGRVNIGSDGKTTIANSDNNAYKHIIIQKSENIEYIYMYVTTYNWVNTEILYFENYEDNPGQTPTRRINLTPNVNTYTYYPIDFKYSENFCVISLYGNVDKFKAYIGDGYTASLLEYYIKMMEQMNPQQSAEAAEIESQYNEKENQSESLAAGLGSIYMPSISSNDLDILSRVDTNQKNNFFGILSIITNNSYITTLLLIIVTGAIVGFILYGKKS